MSDLRWNFIVEDLSFTRYDSVRKYTLGVSNIIAIPANYTKEDEWLL